MKEQFEIKFVKSGRGKAQCESHPDYPNGIALDVTDDPERRSCTATIPYPAPECGMWHVRCKVCLMNIAITAAGRADDPISLTIPCDIESRTQ